MASVRANLKLVTDPAPANYSAGYVNGLDDGQRFANARFFWYGVVAGALLAAIVLLICLPYVRTL